MMILFFLVLVSILFLYNAYLWQLAYSQDMITDHLVEPYEDSLDELAKHFLE